MSMEDKISILLQINSTGERTKSGVSIEEATDIYREISDKFKNLNLKGVHDNWSHK